MMFEEQYRKYCREIKPSEELNDETLALMKEARDHRATIQPPAPLKWKPAVVLPIAGTAAAAAVALVIVGVWLTRGNGDLQEEAGDISAAFGEDSFYSTADPDDDYDSAIQDYLDENEPAEKPEDSSASDTVGGSANSTTGSSDIVADSPTDSTGNSDDDSSSDSAGDILYGSGTSSGEENDAPEDEGQSTEPALPADPYGPEISQEKNVETYLSIRDYLDALTQKTAPGYGSNYYNARELLIVPNLLPDGARFRHLYLNTRTGKYSYSYHFTKDGKDYIIDVEVNVVTPKNLNELRLYKEHAAEEEILTAKDGDRLYYQFGEQDLVTVTLTDVTATVPLTTDETAALLTQFDLERCSLLNPVLDMKY